MVEGGYLAIFPEVTVKQKNIYYRHGLRNGDKIIYNGELNTPIGKQWKRTLCNYKRRKFSRIHVLVHVKSKHPGSSCSENESGGGASKWRKRSKRNNENDTRRKPPDLELKIRNSAFNVS